jgi:hypothetical protein
MVKHIIVGAIIAAACQSTSLYAAQTQVLETALAQSQPAEDQVVASGSMWTKASNKVEGVFRFEQRGKDTYLVIGDSFKTKSGPDLKFVLSPLAHDKVKGKTALSGSIIIAELRSNSGAQEFKIPRGTDLSKYESLLVHCEQYTKLWAAAPINDGELLEYGNSWTKKSNKISGAWEIANTDEGLVIRLGKDFKTSNAPDLKLFFANKGVRSSNGDNATSGSTFVAKLRSNRGASEYVLKGVHSLKEYRSMLIHCEQYSKLWGGVDLHN